MINDDIHIPFYTPIYAIAMGQYIYILCVYKKMNLLNLCYKNYIRNPKHIVRISGAIVYNQQNKREKFLIVAKQQQGKKFFKHY